MYLRRHIFRNETAVPAVRGCIIEEHRAKCQGGVVVPLARTGAQQHGWNSRETAFAKVKVVVKVVLVIGEDRGVGGGKCKSRVRSGGRKDEDWRKVRLYGYRPRFALHSGAEQESRENQHISAIFAKVGELFATLIFVALP
ncbi:hypothetical protein Y032_0029g1870 [Ancylostoma ceylanicum]|uniref:Uncharacterized protein n=1 Tax=Ancylostoma ceylanicum TaxID=53326 RepID=A0A016US72_9BILA|nr:hypothetical protein Y032_0029g1870 [Ancylostoma ceylanicum]